MAKQQENAKSRWPTTMKQDHWQQMWNMRDIGFHQSQVHPDLLKHQNLLMKPGCRVYVPLCGKSLDLVYLADQGYDVVGCEFVEMAVKEFFDEQKLEYTVSKDSAINVSVYKASSMKLSIYQGDFFVLSSSVIGKFDVIWDRASIVAINISDREKYAKTLIELMAPRCKSLLNLLTITGKNYVGPPHSINAEDIKKLFGSVFKYKEVDATHFPFEHPAVDSLKITNLLLEHIQ